jgi:hypothetical protein
MERHATGLAMVCADCGRSVPYDLTDPDVASRLAARREQARSELREAENHARILRERDAWRRAGSVTSIETRRRTR